MGLCILSSPDDRKTAGLWRQMVALMQGCTADRAISLNQRPKDRCRLSNTHP